jgi:hypothetical protein
MTKIRRNLPNNQYLAAILANSPSTSNVFATIADLADLSTAITSASKLQHAVKYAEQINKGQAVYVSSADGTNMIVSKASNATEGTSSKTLGLVLATGNANYQGTVVTEGLQAGLNTNGANAGDPVWLGVNGNLIFGLVNKPVAPAHLVFIGIVTRVNTNNGEIFVKVQNGFELNEIHDVSLPSYTDKGVLYRDVATNLWKHATIATLLGYTPANSTFTIATSGPLNGSSDLSGIGMTLSITQATNLTAGYLSSADWTVFNNKVSTTRSISTTAPLSGGGDLSLDRTISISKATTTVDGYLSATDWTIFNGKQAALGFTPANKAGDTFTGNIFASNLSGTNTGDESTASVKAKLGAATSTTDGYLTFGDWITFNAKQNAIGYTPANKAGETFTGSISATNLSNTNTGDETTVSIKTKLGSASSTIDGYLLATDWVIFNSKVSTTRTISTTAPLSGGGNLSGDLTLSMSQASASANGYLTSSDWSTFSGKQNALGFTPQQQITLTTIGYEGVATLSGSTLNIPSYRSVTYVGDYVNGDGYNAGDVVLYNNSLYYCILTIGSASIPTSDPTHWSLFLPGGSGGGSGSTNLSFTPGVNNGIVVSDSGTDATILAADSTNAGLILASEKTKLAGIAAGAEVNVNADWNATSGDAQILNKPVIKEGVYSYEIHVSQVDGNDTTGNGAVLNPVATITKALTLITGQRRTIIIHPGSYTESPSITTQYTVLTTFEPLGGNTSIIGTVSTSVGCTISGLTIQNLTITAGSGVGVPNIINCNITGTLTKSGNATFTDIHNCEIGTALNITGSGLVTINDGVTTFLTVNNASANVIVKNSTSCIAPSLLAGSLSIVDCVVVAAVTTAITSSAGSIITLANSQILTSALTNVAPIVLNGFYSILNCVFDKPTSTLVALSGTGGSTNSIDYFQYINADKFIKQGGTASQFLKADGSVDTTAYQAALTLTTTGTSGAATLIGSTLNVPQYSGATVPQSITNSSLIFYSNNC